MTIQIDLKRIRESLASLEDSIIVSLFTRSRLKLHERIYVPGAMPIPNFDGSFLDFLFIGTEKLHALAGRYLDAEENPFYPNPPKPIVPRAVEDQGLGKKINYNRRIMQMYLASLPSICETGEDNNYGNAAVADILCLQNISKRVHLGQQVAEAKFQENPDKYTVFIHSRDVTAIMEQLTDREVEETILDRVKTKGDRYQLNPKFIANFYREGIIPLTKEVEIEYLLKRLEI